MDGKGLQVLRLLTETDKVDGQPKLAVDTDKGSPAAGPVQREKTGAVTMIPVSPKAS